MNVTHLRALLKNTAFSICVNDEKQSSSRLSQINTPRGHFDFDALFEDGNVNLAVGQSVCVPMHHHPVVLDGSYEEAH